jgi:uncharacterized protein (DUF1800 family)
MKIQQQLYRYFLLLASFQILILCSLPQHAEAFSAASTRQPRSTIATTTALASASFSRRDALVTPLIAAATTSFVVFAPSSPTHAYTPDPDPLRESLYLMSRVQEATCLQERYIEKSRPPIQKMKLTLRLVDRSYRLLDQVNYISKFLDADSVVPATQLGFEAADALKEAIDFVNAYKQPQQENTNIIMTIEQRDFLKESLTDTREKIFEFLDYLPDQSKVLDARRRVEEENKLNKDEFDPDLATDAGVYNPIVLPWIDRKKKSA